MTEQELIEYKEKLDSLINQGQAMFDSIKSIAEKASKADTELNEANAKIIELRSKSETETNSISEQLNKAITLFGDIVKKQAELDAHYNCVVENLF